MTDEEAGRPKRRPMLSSTRDSNVAAVGEAAPFLRMRAVSGERTQTISSMRRKGPQSQELRNAYR
eukprot:2951282-Pleurochrysis_carterae.AAC.3